MSSDETSLNDALARSREGVGVHLASARGPAAFALLRLSDALDRVAFVLSGATPPAQTRAWRGELDAVDVAACLDAAVRELADALRDAAEALAPALRTSLQTLRGALESFAARFRGGGYRGGETRPTPAAPVAVASVAAAVGAPALEAAPGETARPEQVSFAASAPAHARAGDEFVARFAAYLPADDAEVRAMLAAAGADARLSAVPKSGGLLRGTAVEIALEAADLLVDGAAGRGARRFAWDGKPQVVEFDVAVPATAAPRKLVLKFYVRVAGVVLERIALELELGDAPASGAVRRESAGARLRSTAFASYSSADRPRVLDRVAAIRIAAGIDVFLDCMDLNPSEEWEPRLRGEIDGRDLFILFWSAAAAKSRWVAWEWERALETKGMEGMQIQPLENGVPPPRRLSGVHVADPYVDLRQAELARRAAPGGASAGGTS